MEETTRTLSDYLAILKRRWRLIAAVAGSLLFISVLIAFGLPAVYRSSATILIEAQEIPSDLVRSTITSFADEQIQVITQRAMTNQNLSAIIDKFNLYADDRQRVPLTELIDDFREDVTLDVISADVVDPQSGRPTQATIAFTLSFDHRSPAVAQKVANELVTLYLNENLRTRTRSATETSDFLSGETAKLDKQIGELEEKIAAFKRENEMRLPELNELNLQLMDRADRDLAEVERSLHSVEEQKIFLQAQLATINPTMSMMLATGEPVVGPEDQLRALRTQESRLSSIYGADHPDVKRVRREIAALEAQVDGGSNTIEIEQHLAVLRTELEAARQRYSDDHPDVTRLQRQIETLESELAAGAGKGASTEDSIDAIDRNSNPAYVSLLTQLRSAEADERALKDQRAQLKEKLDTYEKRIFETPQVEAEYSGLTRELENKRAKYQETLAKQLEAQRAQTLEQERMGERFLLIEPPLEPVTPYSPNRIAILLMGVVFSIAGGVGTAALAENFDRSVRGSRSVAAITGAMPIAVIPVIPTGLEKDDTRKRRVVLGAAAAGVIGVVLLAVHAFIKPLDVLWFVALRKLGG